MSDKRFFCPCPHCKTRVYEYDSGTFDDVEGRYLFNFKCPKCERVFNDQILLNKDTLEKQRKGMSEEVLKVLMNPKNLAKLTKRVQEEYDNE